MVAFRYRMPAGIPGAVNRVEQLTSEAQIMDTGTPVTLFGVPVKIVSGLVRPIASGDAASLVYGFLIRPYPTQNVGAAYGATDGYGAGTPNPNDIANVMTRGYMTVQLNNVTAAVKGGQVYVRVASGTTQNPIGGIEAGADGGNCVAITGAIFMGPADAAGNTEIRYNI